MPNLEPRLPSILERHEADLLTEWMTAQFSGKPPRLDGRSAVRREC